MVRQYPRRQPCRHRRRPGADPRGHRLFHHCRGRSADRALCLVLDRGDHRLCRRPARHDLGRDRRDCRADGDAGARLRPAIPAGDDGAGGPAADRHGALEAGPADAVRLQIGDDRLRQRPRHPDLPRAAARADQRHLADLCHGRGRPCHHLSVPPPDPRHSLATGLHHRLDHTLDRPRARRAHRRRHGRTALDPADLPHPADPAQLRDADHHLPLCRGDRRGRAAGIADDRPDRRRPH